MFIQTSDSPESRSGGRRAYPPLSRKVRLPVQVPGVHQPGQRRLQQGGGPERPVARVVDLHLFRLPDVWRRGYAADCRVIKAYAAKKCQVWTDRPGVIGSDAIARRRSIPKGICPGLNMEFRVVFNAIPLSSVVADRYEARAFPGGASVRRVLRSAAARRRASGTPHVATLDAFDRVRSMPAPRQPGASARFGHGSGLHLSHPG